MPLLSWLHSALNRRPVSGRKKLPSRYRDAFQADLFVSRLEERRVLAAPTIDPITDPGAILEDAPEQTVNFTGVTDADGDVQEISVAATSDTPGLIPDPTVTYTSGDTNGSLKYTPVANQSGAAVITVTVTDGGVDNLLSTTGDNEFTEITFNVNVTAVNDAPTLLDTAVTLNDVAEDAGMPSGAVGTLVTSIVGFTGGGGQENVMEVDSSAVTGIAITDADATNGTWWYTTDGGTNWSLLGAVADNSARVLAADADTRIYFQPNANFNGTVDPAITFRAWDQSDGTMNGTAGVDTSTNGDATALSTATDTASLTVNDAPVLTDTDVMLNDVAEDAGAPSGAVGTLVTSIVDFDGGGGQNNVTDVNGGAVTGVAITAADTTNGTWWYSTDDGANWSALGSVSDSSARVLAADGTTRIYFEPNADFNGTVDPAITFRAWDQTDGSANGDAGVDTTTNGGTTAFSTFADTASQAVTAVNDAPTLLDTAVTLNDVAEDAGMPTGAVGTLVTSIVGFTGGGGQENVMDVDSGAVTGIAITNADATNGTWWYTTNGGTNWSLLGAVANDSARVLAADGNTRIYFEPNADFNGTVDPAITFRAWDQTDGSANGDASVDTTTNGGTTAYSTFADTASQNVTAVNDAPMLIDTAVTLNDVAEDAGAPVGAVGTLVTSIVGFTLGGGQENVMDVDSGAMTGIAIISADSTNGTWWYTIDGGTNWNMLGAVADDSARVLAADGNTRIYFEPNADFNGTVDPAITFRAWDQTDGSANGDAGVDTTTNGGTTAFSTFADTASQAVTAVNDAPMLIDTAVTLNDVAEDAGAPVGAVGTLVTSIVGFTGGGGQENVMEVDSGAVTGIAITNADATNGTWWYTTNGGTNWSLLGAVANDSARVLAADGNTRIYFEPNADFNGTVDPAITFRAWDQTDGSANGDAGVDTTTNGGTTAFSTFADTASKEVTSVNDQPTLTSTGQDPTFTEGGAAQTLYSGTSVSTVEAGQLLDRVVLTVTNVTDTGLEFLQINNVNVDITANATDVAAGTIGGDAITVDVSLAGTTATITIKNNAGLSEAETATLVNGLKYENTSQDPTATARVVTLTQLRDTGPGTAPDDNLNDALAVTSTVTVVAVNAPPTLMANGLDPTFTEGGGAVTLFDGAAASTVESMQNIDQFTLTVTNLNDAGSEFLVINGADVLLTTTNANINLGGGIKAAVTFNGVTKTATVVVSKGGGMSTATVETLVDGMKYRNDSMSPTAAPDRVVTLTSIQDDGGTADGGNDTAMLSIASTVTVASVNDPPTLTATALDPTYTEGTAAEQLFNNTMIDVVEATDNVQTLMLTVAGLQNGSSEILVVDGTDVALTNGTMVTTAANSYMVSVAEAAGTATVTITRAGNITVANAQTLVDGLAYRNDSQDPLGTMRVVTLTSIQDTGGTNNGGDDTGTPNIASTVTVAAVNDEPTLNSTGQTPTFTEGDAAVTLFSGTTVSTVESGQQLDRVVLTVTNVTDAGFEFLQINGVNVDVTTNANNVAAGMIGGDAITVDVSLAGTTATITIKNNAGLSEAETQTLVDGLKYENTSQDPTAAMRVVTLTSIRDTGGTANGGDNTGTPGIASTVTVVAVNDEPTLTATAQDPTFTEGGAAQTLYSGTSVSTVEAGQELDRVVLTVTNVTDAGFEFLRINGVDIDLTANATSVAVGMIGGDAITVDVSLSGTTATVTIKNDLGLSENETESLVNGLAYQNTSQNPTAGMRVVTLTQLRDTGPGTAPDDNLNDTLAVASTVTVVAVNDEPTLTSTGQDPTFTEGDPAVVLFSGTSVSTIEAGQELDRVVLTVTNVSNAGAEFLRINGVEIDLTANATDVAAGTIGGDAITVDVSLSGTTATVTIKNDAGLSEAETEALVDGLAYRNDSQDPSAAMRVVTITQLRDTGPGTAPDDNLNATLVVTSTVTVVPVNDEPTLTSTGQDPTFTEGGALATLFSGTSVSTVEAGQELDRLVLTVTNVTDAGSEFLQINGVDVDITAAAANVAAGMIGGDAITVDVTLAGTTATLTIKNNAELSEAETESLVDGLAYDNTSQDPTAGMRVVTLTQLRDTGSGTAPDDNLNDTLAVTSTVTVVAVNDPPTLTATGLDPNHIEDLGAKQLFNGTTIDLVEAADNVQSLTVTVANLQNGVDEVLVVDGTDVVLTNGTMVTTAANGYMAGVAVAGSTATVTITRGSTITVANAQTLVDGLAYRNDSQDPLGNRDHTGPMMLPLLSNQRTVTLTAIQDTGGTADGGNDTGTPGITSTVTVTPVNDAPTVTAVNFIVTEDQLPAVLFQFNADDVDNDPSTLTYLPNAAPSVTTSNPTINSMYLAAFQATYTDLTAGQFQIPTPGNGFQHLAQGETATITFDYSVTDPGGLPSPTMEKVTITVNGLNDQPVLSMVSFPAAGINEGQSAHFEGTITDPDFSDVHSLDVDYGDGSGTVNVATGVAADLSANTGMFSFDHVYPDDPPGDPNTVPDIFDVSINARDGFNMAGDVKVVVQVPVNNLDPAFASVVAQDISGDGVARIKVVVADPGVLDVIQVTVFWNDPLHANPDDPLFKSEFTVPLSGGQGAFEASHTYEIAQDPTVNPDASRVRIRLTADDQDGGTTSDAKDVTVAGTGLASIPFDVTPATPQIAFALPNVVSSPPNVVTNISFVQAIDFRSGQAGPSQGSNEQLILKALTPDGKENDDGIPLGRENERPEDVLRRLPEVFKKLTDGEYRIYLKREDGTLRLVLDVVLRRHKPIDPSELKKIESPAAKSKEAEPKKKEAAEPKTEKKDAGAGPKLNAPQRRDATDKPQAAPKPADLRTENEDFSHLTRESGLLTRKSDDSRNAAVSGVAAVAAWAGVDGLRRWQNHVDEQMARWSSAGFVERKRRLARTRRTNKTTN